MQERSNLLFDEYPLVINPGLAKMIGLNEAIVLQQVHYWVQHNSKKGNNLREGYYWTYNSYREWQEQFPFWSLRTIKTVVKELENRGFLISANFNKMKTDRTKWYRVDYDSCTMHSAEIAPSECSSYTMQGAEIAPPLPETTTETIPEETTSPINRESLVSEVIIGMQAYYGYPERTDIDPIPNYGKEGKAIKRLLSRGFGVDEIISCWMSKVKKAGQFKSMVYVNEDIKIVPRGQGHDKSNTVYHVTVLRRRYVEVLGRDLLGHEIATIRSYVEECEKRGASYDEIAGGDPLGIGSPAEA